MREQSHEDNATRAESERRKGKKTKAAGRTESNSNREHVVRKSRQRGRKTLWTAQLQAQFCEALAKCHTIKDACARAGIGESTFYLWLLKGMTGEEPYLQFVEMVQLARARVRSSLVDEIITDRDWRAKAWYLERTWPEAFGPVAHRFIVKEVPQVPPPAPIITVKHVRADENER